MHMLGLAGMPRRIPDFPDPPSAPGGGAPNAPGAPGAPSAPGNSAAGAKCETIRAKVRNLLGINADAIVCLDGLLKVITSGPVGGLLSGILGGNGNGSGNTSNQQEVCETIKAHANALGIEADAVVCLPDIKIQL
ncbi:hypothetical protein K7432_010364 [Basidiobolus ranarum]|uniref:Uncharacterized protein n=1 Tax=Basidiobolus ranarum TaxID=34480 RepID=A0ABR2VVJ2_9FUNG